MDYQVSSTPNIFSEFDDQERTTLIKRLVAQDRRLAILPRELVLFYWFCDISKLRALANYPECDYEERYFAMIQPIKPDLAGIWAGNVAAEGPRKKLPSKEVSKNVKRRDGRQCLLTKRGQPVLRHIIPTKLNDSDTTSNGWQILSRFWQEEKIDKYKAALGLFKDGDKINTEKAHNILSLELQTHHYWKLALVGFRPIRESISEDRTSMDVEFHWMPMKKLPEGAAQMIPFDQCPYSPEERHGIITSDPPGMAIYHQEKKIPLQPGYTFQITTTDPVNMPLPSVDLLELQWHLTRIVAMTGGRAEYDQYASDNEDY